MKAIEQPLEVAKANNQLIKTSYLKMVSYITHSTVRNKGYISVMCFFAGVTARPLVCDSYPCLTASSCCLLGPPTSLIPLSPILRAPSFSCFFSHHFSVPETIFIFSCHPKWPCYLLLDTPLENHFVQLACHDSLHAAPSITNISKSI